MYKHVFVSSLKILVTKPKGKRPVGPVRRIHGRTIVKWVLKN
jgi:hypothetical protein